MFHSHTLTFTQTNEEAFSQHGIDLHAFMHRYRHTPYIAKIHPSQKKRVQEKAR